MMVGRDVTAARTGMRAPPGAVRLTVENLCGPGLGPISFELGAGEVLGVAGVDGNGQIELVETLAGSIRLDGRDISQACTPSRVRAGLAYIPADRAATSLVRGFSVAENLMLRDSARPPYARRGLLSRAGFEAKAQQLMRDYAIRAPGPATPVARLSGGNQQKIVAAPELDRQPAALIAHQAAWGLDPGATRFVADRVLALREAGGAILYLSSELDEVLDLADRVAVLAEGRLAGVVTRGRVDLGQIDLWMSGRAT
jgi:ABC-type uncharacterized transport system ATPase subunit